MSGFALSCAREHSGEMSDIMLRSSESSCSLEHRERGWVGG